MSMNMYKIGSSTKSGSASRSQTPNLTNNASCRPPQGVGVLDLKQEVITTGQLDYQVYPLVQVMSSAMRLTDSTECGSHDAPNMICVSSIPAVTDVNYVPAVGVPTCPVYPVLLVYLA